MSEEITNQKLLSPILFLEDWDKLGGVAHLNTRNKSALVFAKMLKEMGVKNYFFHLSLFDTDLYDVNPHDENLTASQKIKIYIECCRNPWYLLREVMMVPAGSGDSGSLIEFNRGIVCLWWLYLNNIVVILVQPRQTGKSFGMQLLTTGMLNFYLNGSKIMQLTKDDKLRSSCIETIESIYHSLPPYLQLRDKEDSNNKFSFTVNAKGNSLHSILSNKSVEMAAKAGRGLTSENVWLEEAPWIPNLKTAMASAIPVMGNAMKRARKNNSLFGMAFTTTAGDKEDQGSGQFLWNQVIAKAAVFYEKYYDCRNNEELRETVLKAGSDPIVPRVYAAFNYLQVNRDHNWAAEMISLSGGNMDEAMKDYLNIWGTAGTSGLLNEKVAKDMLSTIREPQYVQILPGYAYTVKWFCSKERSVEYTRYNRKIVIGMDSSEAIGNDATEFYGVDVLTGQLVFCATILESMIPKMCSFIFELLERMPMAVFVPEKKSTGAAIVDYLIVTMVSKGIDPFKRIFNWIVNDHTDPKFAEIYKYICNTAPTRRGEGFYEKTKKYFGYSTSGAGQSSRDVLYVDLFPAAINKAHLRIYDEGLIRQILGLRIKNGRIDHANGGHDDKVVAWLMVYYFMLMAKNLNHYGIYPLEVLKDNTDGSENTKDKISKLTPAQKYKYDKANTDLQKYKDLYIDCRGVHLANMLEEKIIAAAKELAIYDDSTNIVSTASAYIEQIKDKKKFSKMSKVDLPVELD